MADDKGGFKVETIHDCPHTRGSGVAYLPVWLINEIAGAVADRDEWAIILKGMREDEGRIVKVTDYYIPQQDRSAGQVKLPDIQFEPDTVGVVHSHHSMGARFSTTDDQFLNPRFPFSIVVAQNSQQYLGFSYQAEGRVSLPCGSLGVIQFQIQPWDEVSGEVVGPVVATVNKEVIRPNELGKCTLWQQTDKDDVFHVRYQSDCGLVEEGLKRNAFGNGTNLKGLVELLPRIRYSKKPQGGVHGVKQLGDGGKSRGDWSYNGKKYDSNRRNLLDDQWDDLVIDLSEKKSDKNGSYYETDGPLTRKRKDGEDEYKCDWCSEWEDNIWPSGTGTGTWICNDCHEWSKSSLVK